MQWVSKAVQYYKDINPATLTGAIDVIVVERPAAVPGEVELACSPFHVRFGKLSVLRPVDKKVRISVNDERVPFYMKVGETGEAFFVFETDADVPESLQTSPLSGPVSDDGQGDSGDPEPFDLDAPAMGKQESSVGEADEDQLFTPTPSHPSSPNSSRYASLASTNFGSPTGTLRTIPQLAHLTPHPSTDNLHALDTSGPVEEGRAKAEAKSSDAIPGPIARAVEKAAGMLPFAAAGNVGHEIRDAKLKHDFKKDVAAGAGGTATESGLIRPSSEDPKGRKAETGRIDPDVEERLAGMSIDGKTMRSTGDEVIKAAREQNADVEAILGGSSGTGLATSHDGMRGSVDFSMRPLPTGPSDIDVATGKILRNAAGEEVGVAPANTGALMLDMSGYKVDKEKEAREEEVDQRIGEELAPTMLGINAQAEKEIISFTQALLQSTDPTTLANFFEPSTDEEAGADSSVPPLDLNPGTPASDRKVPETRSRHSSRASSPPPRPVSISSLQSLHAESEIAPSPDDGVFHASPKQFSLKIGGKVHVFEMSLCGSEEFGHEQRAADRAFLEHQVTFNQFMEQTELTENPDLVVKYAGRYLTWDNASPVLASLSVYRRSLVEHPEHHRHVDQTSKRSGRWSLWWGRNRNSTVQGDAASTVSLPGSELSPPTSPPMSPPDSPRSVPTPDPPPLDRSDAASPPLVHEDDFPPEDHTKHYAKTLRLTSEQLKALKLNKGMNTISFSVRSSYSGYATCTSRIFLWEGDYQVVISDIDGTITKSDALGHVFTMIGRDWTHLGVAKLYTDISRNGYKMMYLTSRAIGQADTTREYLKGIKQNGFQLPDGPVIMSPDRLMTSLHREVIMRKPEVFKMACLRDIQRLFGERSPFYAGFGNRITDALSYRSVDIPSSRIFTIDSNGEVKMELLELAGYKSSYIHMTDLVDQMFPPINKTTVPDFTDFNYWRAPLPQIDFPELAPPSPALSARSDQSSSRIAFPRLGTIASSLSRRSSRSALSDTGPPSRSTRGTTPSSPLLSATVAEDPVELEEDDLDQTRYNRHHRSSSMPGSLPEDGDFERYYHESKVSPHATTEAEEYKQKIKGQRDDDDEEEEEEDDADFHDHDAEEEGEGDDFGDQLDFSSVPYL
ncbi:phosphatidate phosphatase PAH1 [Sporobolomyces koalae]|uniref:phosphatidate phosphatase PAH1 n=1 Tax=Sporobolomyces koalae TaxID=500713 RepID=UPI00317363EC